MNTPLNGWLKRFFLNADLNKLFLVIAVILLTLWLFINELTPLLIGIVVAYVLKEPAKKLEQLGLSRALSAGFITILLVLFISVCLYALPKLLLQFRGLGGEAPQIFKSLAALTESINNILPEDLAIESKDVSGKLGVFSANIGDYILKKHAKFCSRYFFAVCFYGGFAVIGFLSAQRQRCVACQLAKIRAAVADFRRIVGGHG